MIVQHIYNITDVTEPPGRRVKLFGVHVPAGGVLRISSDKLQTRPVQARLEQLVAAQTFWVGPLPTWYVEAKQAARTAIKSVQARRLHPRPILQVEEPVPELEASYVRQELRKLGKQGVIDFVLNFDLPVEVSTKMKWEVLLDAVDKGMEKKTPSDEDVLAFFKE